VPAGAGCQGVEPDDWKVAIDDYRSYRECVDRFLKYAREELAREELQRRPRRPVWPHVVTATSCAFLGALLGHIGLTLMPSVWAWVCLFGTCSLLPLAGLVVGLGISRE
jgi:hypothetical protein